MGVSKDFHWGMAAVLEYDNVYPIWFCKIINYDSLIFNLNGARLIEVLQIRSTHQQEETPDSG